MELQDWNQFGREVGAAEGGPSWWRGSLDGHMEGHQSLAVQRAGACIQGAETQTGAGGGWRVSPCHFIQGPFGCMAEGAGREGEAGSSPVEHDQLPHPHQNQLRPAS